MVGITMQLNMTCGNHGAAAPLFAKDPFAIVKDLTQLCAYSYRTLVLSNARKWVSMGIFVIFNYFHSIF
jgi:hypothetical protein